MNSKKNKKVVIAMSGGVDSSVSASLLCEEGYDVTGVFMKCWDEELDEIRGCTAEEDEYWARRVAALLDIPFYRFDLVNEYKSRVYDYFINEYNNSRTPNPDILCNSEIKFGVFFDKVTKVFDCDFVATGHYSRIQRNRDNYNILKGIDKNKDQSYFLYRIDKNILNKVLFPVGEMKKTEVRDYARKKNLPNSEKKDSQGLCFVGNIKIRDFLKGKIKIQKGNVVNQDGEIVGIHQGLSLYTIGQRRGVGSFGGGVPYYVIDKNIKNNELIVGYSYDEGLFKDSVLLKDCVWFVDPLKSDEECEVAIRYRQEPQNAIIKYKDGDLIVKFLEPQRAVTEGQSAVIYKGEVLLGGGIISSGDVR